MIERDYGKMYEYESKHGVHGPKWVVTGVDMFDYDDYLIALCDTREEVDQIIEERTRPSLAPRYTDHSTIQDAIWIFGPHGSHRQRVR